MATKYFSDIGIIGGTGVYDSGLFNEKKDIKVYTPFGEPSDLIVTIGEFAGRKVAFIPRHGKGHRIPPHKVNSRANIWALKQLGVKRIIAPTTVGSMKNEYKPGTLQFPNSLLTLRKEGIIRFMMEERFVISQLPIRSVLSGMSSGVKPSKKLEYTYHKKATYVCIEGPRFSTRAESQFFRDVMKADIIGMTLVPECPLAEGSRNVMFR